MALQAPSMNKKQEYSNIRDTDGDDKPSLPQLSHAVVIEIKRQSMVHIGI